MHPEQNQQEKLRQYAKAMRRQMTPEERRLWFELFKGHIPRVRRQAVKAGYIVDFCCEKAGVIIELDGSQHDGRSRDALPRYRVLERTSLRDAPPPLRR